MGAFKHVTRHSHRKLTGGGEHAPPARPLHMLAAKAMAASGLALACLVFSWNAQAQGSSNLKVSAEEAGGHAVMAVLIEQIARCNDGPMPEGFHRALTRARLIEARDYDINAEQFSYALRAPMTVGKGLRVTHVALLGHENSGYSWVGLTLGMTPTAAEAALKASGWPVRGKVRAKKETGEFLVRQRALVPAINMKGSTNWLCGFDGN